MKPEDLKAIINALFDRPLNSADSNLVVDRQADIEKLNLISTLHPSGIYGLCGETGVGKTTVLELIGEKGIKKLKIILTEKDSKENIIGDLLYKLCLALEKESKKISEKARSTKKLLLSEISKTSSFSIGGSAIVSATGTKSVSKIEKFNIYEAKDKLRELIAGTIEENGKTLLVIDELDKEKKEDVLSVVDSLKMELNMQDLIVVLALPFSIYREYAKDRMRWNKSGNLENVFKDVVYLSELSDEDIQELLLRRLVNYVDLFDAKAYSKFVLFADGNPRDALWITSQTVLDNMDAEKITGEIAEKSIRKIVKEYQRFGKKLTETQLKILQIIVKNPGEKAAIIEALQKSGIKRTTAYVTLDRLLKAGWLIERNEIIRVSRKVYFIL